ncbi:MAG: bifunctional diaminohydroxyphosphoribosylaminopyrimidine deaminase/5-amino-6-(5-phosphoribosylamino)uracil reductase RibD [Sedimentisphaerales bacterium]
MTSDERYMRMALKLAKRGVGSVEPNPAVGAVIVKDNQVIGKGWHKKFGGPHAEINALEDCKKLAFNPQGATMYVTLEPCCHQGKTALCTDAIIADKLAKIVVATVDPSKHANGKGIEQLRNAGIDVQVGLCEKEARLLNAPFIKFATMGISWVILKWAQSIDGKLSYSEGKERWISGEQSRKDVQNLRRRVQGILVGINTVIADDPRLTARPSRDEEATRVVLDSSLRIPLNCRLLATAKRVPVLIVTSEEAVRTNAEKWEKIVQKGAELLTVPTMQGRCDLDFLVGELSRRGIAQLLVEGGPTVIISFLKQGLADEICVYISPKILGGCGSVDISGPMAELIEAVGLHYVDIKRFGNDVRIAGFSKKAIDEILVVES